MVSLVGASQKNKKHIILLTIILILNDQSSHIVTSINIFRRTQVIAVQRLNSSLIQIRFSPVVCDCDGLDEPAQTVRDQTGEPVQKSIAAANGN